MAERLLLDLDPMGAIIVRLSSLLVTRLRYNILISIPTVTICCTFRRLRLA